MTRRSSLNPFQIFLRGLDTAKSAIASSVSTDISNHVSKKLGIEKSNLISMGTFQLGCAFLTAAGLLGRIYEDPKRLQSNLDGIVRY